MQLPRISRQEHDHAESPRKVYIPTRTFSVVRPHVCEIHAPTLCRQVYIPVVKGSGRPTWLFERSSQERKRRSWRPSGRPRAESTTAQTCANTFPKLV